jgi:hypothetical protein
LEDENTRLDNINRRRMYWLQSAKLNRKHFCCECFSMKE